MSLKRADEDRQFLDYQKTVRLSDSTMEALKTRKERTGVPVNAQIRRAIEKDLADNEDDSLPISVLGYIPASPAAEVVHLPPSTTVRPPFKLGEDCYGLIVTGDSMTQADGLSIPDGSYAFFCPDITPFFGAVVHVEWPIDKDGGEHFCTLKRYCPQPDGKTVYFEPLNKSHKRIVRKEGEFIIRGVFSRAWDGK